MQNKTTKQVGAYTRVSTDRQAQSQTIEQQIERLKEYDQTHAVGLSEKHIYRDDGYSGATLNRPGLDRLREAVRDGLITHIMITAPDRLARSYVHQMLLLDEFKQAGVTVIFVDRPMSEDPHDQLLLQIRGAVAEYERTLIADRMRRGRQMKFRAGKLLPWTRAPYGYRVDPEHPRDPQGVRIDEAEAAVIRDMFEWYAKEGRSLFGLAHRLVAQKVITPNGKTRWNPASIRGMLTNPVYTGQVYMNRTHSVDARGRSSATHPAGNKSKSSHAAVAQENWIFVMEVPAIIETELFEAVQRKLSENRMFARRNNHAHDYLLRALVSCGVCQSACVSCSKGDYPYYICRAKADPVQTGCDTRCSARYVPARQLDEMVWEDLCNVIAHPESLKQALERAHNGHWLSQDLKARRETLRKARANLTAQVDRLTEAYLAEIIKLSEYQRRRQALQAKLDSIDEQNKYLQRDVDRQSEIAALTASMTEFCQRIQAGLASASFEQKRQLVELLIDRVIVNGDQVEIRYVIPVSSKGELTRFCHLRLDYFDGPAIGINGTEGGNGSLIHIGDQEHGLVKARMKDE